MNPVLNKKRLQLLASSAVNSLGNTISLPHVSACFLNIVDSNYYRNFSIQTVGNTNPITVSLEISLDNVNFIALPGNEFLFTGNPDISSKDGFMMAELSTHGCYLRCKFTAALINPLTTDFTIVVVMMEPSTSYSF